MFPVLTAVIGSFVVLAWIYFARRNAGQSGGKALSVGCPICRQALNVGLGDVRPLSNVEMALAVSAHPSLVGKPLRSMNCATCDAELTFEQVKQGLRYVGVNIYSPQDMTEHCQNCGKPLATPPWAPGTYEGHVAAAPLQQHTHVGLICGRCDARCCYSCVRNTTRGRTSDGALMCPRCFRTPMDRIFYPTTRAHR